VELIGPYLIACALLVVAGLSKAVRPADTARALGALVPIGVAPLVVLVRVGSVAEAAVGSAALIVPGPITALAVAVSYAAFAVTVGLVRSRGGAMASCGCFGTPDTPATALHVVVNAGLALSAAAVAVSLPSGTIVSVLGHQPLHGLPLVAVSALGTWLCYLAVAVLADLEAARRLTGVSLARVGPPGRTLR
jgi:hypothetical protein